MPESVNNMNHEVPFCFLCDHPCCGAYFNLSNCVTDCNGTEISSKLSNLVGEDFIVVIEENDVICRSCFNILNSMERLESQLTKLGNTIFNFFEDKYSLKPGEIFENAPPLEIRFKKEPPNTHTDKETNRTRGTDKKRDAFQNKDDVKPLLCNQCNYSTPFRAFMVFHLREHRKLSNPPLTVNMEEVVEQPASVPSRRSTRIRKNKLAGGVCKRVKISIGDVDTTASLAQKLDCIQVDGIDTEGGYEFITGQDDDHLSEEMLTKVNAFVQGNEVILQEQSDVQISETNVQIPDTEDQLQVFLAESDLLEVVGEPGIFCMLDSSTGKIVQRLKKSDDGSFVPVDLLESEPQTVMHQLADGTFELVLPGLEDSGDGLTLM